MIKAVDRKAHTVMLVTLVPAYLQSFKFSYSETPVSLSCGSVVSAAQNTPTLISDRLNVAMISPSCPWENLHRGDFYMALQISYKQY